MQAIDAHLRLTTSLDKHTEFQHHTVWSLATIKQSIQDAAIDTWVCITYNSETISLFLKGLDVYHLAKHQY